ncbi:hypothetical protein LI221_09070 [Faecalimonas umbilicata]|nr:hypothetical protein [Faecalimonas umbilicata]
MKKTYQKPRIMIEEFSASEIIATASGCGAIVTMMDAQCTSTNNPLMEDAFSIGIFSDSCEIPYSYEEYDGICLHGPADNAIYTS